MTYKEKMKKIIVGLMCLAVASCKISENDLIKPPQKPDKGKLVYLGNFDIENLDHVSLITYTPENSYHLDISSKTLTSKQPSCERTLALSPFEISIFLNTIKQVRICEFVDKYPVDGCTSILPEANNNLWYSYRNAIDPDYLPVNTPSWCASRGLCSHYDIEMALGVFETYKDALSCP